MCPRIQDWTVEITKCFWDRKSNMASKLKKTIVKKSGNKKGKPKKNMVWSEEEARKYAKVLTDCDNKDCL